MRAVWPPGETARVRGLTLLVFVASVALGAAIVTGVEQADVFRQQRVAADEAAQYVGVLRFQVIRSSSATYALAALVRQERGRVESFQALASALISTYGSGISSLQLAPAGVVSHIVPPTGNEAALGMRLLEDPTRNKEAFIALNTRQLNVAGPFPLVQGGIGLVARLPVFLPDDAGVERFWGFVTAVMRIEDLAVAAQVVNLAALGYRYAVWRIHPDTGQPHVFLKSDEHPLSDPVVQRVAMPNGEWLIGIEPRAGWGSPTTRLIGGLVALLLAGLIAAAARKQFMLPLVLRREVQLRTAQLADANHELREKVAELRAAQEHLRKLSRVVEQSQVGVEITDPAGIIEYVNPMFAETTGYSADELRGQPASIVCSGLNPAETYRDLWSKLRAGHEWRGELLNRKKSGELFWESQVISPLVNSQGEVTNFVAVKLDVTERKRAQEELERLNRELDFQANHDQLTGLPNRTLLHDRLDLALAHGRRSGEALAVLMLDLDRFKAVNDSLGHRAGDDLLREVAHRLSDCVRAEDTVARLGGDEFVLLLTAVLHEADVVALAQKIVERLAQPVRLGAQEARVGASIGISLFPKDADDPTTLLKQADLAMYQAKQGGRNGFRFYAAETNARAEQRLALEVSLREAIAKSQLVLHYQPKFDLASGRIEGAEALLRWNCGGAGWVAPAEVLAVAEESGLIIQLGHWVLHTACSAACEWRDAGLPCTVAVNLSSRQFHAAYLIDAVRSALHDTGLDPRCLELEISENATIEQPEAAAAVFRELKSLGVRVSLEDFGIGCSNLSQITHFALDALKIDRSIVHEATRDRSGSAAGSAILSLARNLELDVTAEGVETEAQLRYLKTHGCRHAQGYHLGRPLPKDEFMMRLAA